MQYKRWVANTRQSVVIEGDDAEMVDENEVWSDSEDEIEYNQELIGWLGDWEKENTAADRVQEMLEVSTL